MKILFYINTICHGGAERVMVNLAEQCSSHGHEVALATSYKSQGEYELSENVKRIVIAPEIGEILGNSDIHRKYPIAIKNALLK